MKGYIYCIKSPQTELIYIGSTEQELYERLSKHRRDFKRWLEGKFHYVTSSEIVKFPDCYIELIEEVEVEDEFALHKREGYYQRNMECVNKRIEGRTDQEYYEDNRDEILEKRKIYQAEHNVEIKEKKNIKHDCECGGKYTHCNKSRHIKSKLHLEYLSNERS